MLVKGREDGASRAGEPAKKWPTQSLPENDCRYPEGYHAFSRQNACSAALSPRKMLRSAFRMLATDFGNRLRGRKLHLRSEEHTSELQSQSNLVCRLLLEKKKYTST